MLKNVLLATACVIGLSAAAPLSVAFAAEEATTLSADAQAALDVQISAVEALVVQYQNDPAGLQAAVEALVENAGDPAVTANAVLVVFDNSQNPEIQQILASNSELKPAAGRGLGAAIASIGLTNPDLAAQMSASVVASGDSTMVSEVQSGSDTKTASLKQEQQRRQDADNSSSTDDSTPEKTLSPNG